MPAISAVEPAIGGAPLEFGAGIVPMLQTHLLQRVEIVRQPAGSAATAKHVQNTQWSLLSKPEMRKGGASSFNGLSDFGAPVMAQLAAFWVNCRTVASLGRAIAP
ncbi:hypothetical protein [Sphingopyxis sp. KK2]|uniref:hypothetical protein n=1 Tax=Sphingopyxis sp. KK2 TaxID=1855727 RepID=UPI00097E616B|nr:hypothetical protein [Sphingopyxis sp. KK2]